MKQLCSLECQEHLSRTEMSETQLYLGCLLGPQWEVLSTRGKLVKALPTVDSSWNALREEGALAALVTQEDDVQSLHQCYT